MSHTKLFGPAGELVPGGAAAGGARRPGRVYVCLHGLTNSPQQYVPLAARLLARGDATVFIPRLPRHGLADRMTTGLAQLAEAELVDATAAALDTAAGLGDEVVVTGISMGGVLATWAAQYRPVARVVIVAPALGLPYLPPPTIGPLTALALRLPNRYIWWDPRQKAAVAGPTYAYPRFATHALARIQRLGLRLAAAARTAPPAARSVWLVTNAADLAISNRQVDRLAANWERAGATNLRRYVFPRRLKLFHDLVDPLQPNQQVAVSHPALERLVADGAAPIIPPEAAGPRPGPLSRASARATRPGATSRSAGRRRRRGPRGQRPDRGVCRLRRVPAGAGAREGSRTRVSQDLRRVARVVSPEGIG